MRIYESFNNKLQFAVVIYVREYCNNGRKAGSEQERDKRGS